MTQPVPLEALLRRLSRMAEQHFNRVGDIDPMWLVETASGEQRVIVSPIVAPSPLAAADYKDQLADKMRELFAENGVVRYARAMECWTIPGSGEMTCEQRALQYAALGYTFANHADRREIVDISAEDSTQFLRAFRDIIRPAGGKPYLGKLSAIERQDQVEGRWLGLLPSTGHAAALRERPSAQEPRRIRSSSELADDVGTVFVTAVAGAPLQIYGRRDPANGELCVGGVAMPKGDHRLEMIAANLGGVELVTGPEAERLILAALRHFTEQAEAEGLTFEQYAAKHFTGDRP